MKNKDYSIEMLRTLACFFVVVIHVSGTYFATWGKIPTSNWLFINIFSTLSRFAVPMFTMISGALILKKSSNFKSSIKRILKIILVLLLSSLFYLIVVDLILNGKPFNIKHWILAILEHRVHYHLWYLYMILGLYLLAPILSEIVKHINSKLWIYYICLVLFFATTKFIPNTSLILLGRTISPFIPFEGIGPYLGTFLIGYYLYNVVDINKKGFKISIIGFILSNLVTFFMTYILTKISGIPTETIMDRNGLTSILSSMFLFYIIRYLFINYNIHKKINMIVMKIGSLSLIIYIIHPFVILTYARFFKIYVERIINNFNLYFVIELLVVFIVSLILSYITNTLIKIFKHRKISNKFTVSS